MKLRRLPLLLGTTTLCLGILAMAGCKPSAPPPAATTQAAEQGYDIRGIIKRLPTAKSPHELSVHTETTKDMESMTMSYTLEDNLSLTGLSVGDKVSLHVEVDAHSGMEHVTKIEALPADTALKIPPAATTAAPETEKMGAMPGK